MRYFYIIFSFIITCFLFAGSAFAAQTKCLFRPIQATDGFVVLPIDRSVERPVVASPVKPAKEERNSAVLRLLHDLSNVSLDPNALSAKLFDGVNQLKKLEKQVSSDSPEGKRILQLKKELEDRLFDF